MTKITIKTLNTALTAKLIKINRSSLKNYQKIYYKNSYWIRKDLYQKVRSIIKKKASKLFFRQEKGITELLKKKICTI